MTTYSIGYFVGSLSSTSINRLLARALIRLAPANLEFVEIPIRDLPLYSPDYDTDYPPEAVAQGRSCLLFGFSVWRGGEFQTCLVTHDRSGSTVRAVTINRLATPGTRIAEEIETAILRQLVAEPTHD